MESTTESKSLKTARRMASLEPSATLAMAARASAMAAAGVDVIDLSVGEPDFPTPEHICRAAEAAIRGGRTKYTPAVGIPDLRKAVAADHARRTGMPVTPAQVVVSNGAKHALHNVFTALLDDGDEVIVPTPYWVSYAELIKLTGAKPVLLETKIEDDFKLRPEQLQAALTPRTRMLLLCSPSNPTGVVYSAEELGRLADIAIAADLSVVSDEIYDQLVYDGRASVSFPTLRPGLEQRTIVVAGVSKTYSMTGWRIGWTICPEPLAKAIANLQSQETSNPCSVSQHAAVAALTGPQECVAEMRAAFQRRRDLVAGRLQAMPGVRLPDIGGAFYAFFDIRPALERSRARGLGTSLAWCEALLEEGHVALVAGSAFGAEGTCGCRSLRPRRSSPRGSIGSRSSWRDRMNGAVGIVLAGGRSRRLGDAAPPGGKAALVLDGGTFLERVVAAVAGAVDRVLVVAAPGQPLPPLPPAVEIVRDTLPDGGPLAALRDGLAAAARGTPAPRAAFVVACDVPHLKPEVVRLLLARGRAAGAGWVVRGWDGHPQVLLSVVALDLVPAIEAHLAAGRRDPRGLLVALEAAAPARIVRVTAAELAAVDGRGDSVRDVDTPDDLERLRRRGIPPSAP